MKIEIDKQEYDYLLKIKRYFKYELEYRLEICPLCGELKDVYKPCKTCAYYQIIDKQDPILLEEIVQEKCNNYIKIH